MTLINFPHPTDNEALIVQAHRLAELAERPLTRAVRHEIATRARVLAELAED